MRIRFSGSAFPASNAHRCATALSQGFPIPAFTKEQIMTEAASGILSGKVALVTGAGRGQGRAHALTLARNGADIIAVDIAAQIDSVPYPLSTPDDLAETVKRIEELDRRVIGVQADVRSQEQLDAAVSRALAEFGQIDILIANAGILSLKPFWQLTEADWGDVINTNLSGYWRSAKAVAPHMIDRQAGVIVMTSSINGLEPGMNYAHYVTAKHGVIGLMRNVALELAPHGIRCNAICPGAVDTRMVNWQGMYDMFHGHPGGTRDDLLAGGRSYHALKGFGVLSPQVIADAALWLVSDGAAAVTGVVLPVDAGHRLLTPINPAPALT
jgi:SDR family mycofactocin-dependent oxidoreductase